LQIQHLREALADPGQPDGYNWDMLDGYEGDEPSSLLHHPDLQAKVRRVIMQGFIDPEDFNGVCLAKFAALPCANLLFLGPRDE